MKNCTVRYTQRQQHTSKSSNLSASPHLNYLVVRLSVFSKCGQGSPHAMLMLAALGIRARPRFAHGSKYDKIKLGLGVDVEDV